MKQKPSSGMFSVLTLFLVMFFLLSQVFLNTGSLAAGASPLEAAGNILLLSVPLGLFYFSIWLLAAAVGQRQRGGELSPGLARLVYLTPRAAGILTALFAGTFALEALQIPGPFGRVLGEFLLSLLPALVIGSLTALAWRWEWIGFAAFLLLGLFFLHGFEEGVLRGVGMILLFTGPMLAVAALFWLNWKWRAFLHPGVPAASGGKEN